jgi:hypothetical protein
MEDYLPILRSLRLAGVNYAVIGTWALKAYFPAKMADYELHDCDVVLAPDEPNVRLAIAVLTAQLWEVRIWEELVDAGTPSPDLVGKYYMRARQGNLVLDLTYECIIEWPQMAAQRANIADVWLAAVGDIAELKRSKGTPADLALLLALAL